RSTVRRTWGGRRLRERRARPPKAPSACRSQSPPPTTPISSEPPAASAYPLGGSFVTPSANTFAASCRSFEHEDRSPAPPRPADHEEEHQAASFHRPVRGPGRLSSGALEPRPQVCVRV